ncbi:hypothetical protein V1506DRAFT_540793 [Lipomyces tetrasporus]
MCLVKRSLCSHTKFDLAYSQLSGASSFTASPGHHLIACKARTGYHTCSTGRKSQSRIFSGHFSISRSTSSNQQHLESKNKRPSAVPCQFARSVENSSEMRLSPHEMSHFPLQLSAVILDETEQKIRDLLVDASTDIDAREPDRKEDLVLRFTGGWVRDKLLGQDSHDLDVGINRMTGYDFATKLQGFIVRRPTKYGAAMQGIHKIEMNPEKSKHLETTTTKLYGIDIDLVNLRTETYTESSRVPHMKFGTAEEDALRRDATINALFYNLQTQEVEDFTGKGLEDLRNGMIRTPLRAFTTFHDDPLRVLRLIRFASRFGFHIEDQAIAAMQNDTIRKALQQKISRERIGAELDKMLNGPNPSASMKLIGISKLYEAIFAPLNYAAKSSDAGQGWGSITEFSNLRLVMDRLLKSDKPILTQDDVKDPYIVKLVYLYVALRPWHGLKVSPKFETAFLIIRDSLKLPSSLGTTISGIIKSAAEATSFVRLAEWTRKDAGLFVRQAGQYWRVVLLCALASDIEKLFGNRAQDCSLEQEQVNADLERYLKLEKFIADNNLTNAWQLKPILGGKEVMNVLELQKGPQIAEFLRKVIEWQLEFPDMTREDCVAYLKSLKLQA